ncbi:ATP-binding protein [Streptomyces sp. SL13]|uniref:ATP-binding protein n=1 Tax=Streptantibioticus silvisoli TaxID=2705255 RepID=A0AA90JYN4_9ACTN|nr:ATP-binding protein [Streptantibioticus silvisoli]MDI5971456.1 ATP-binding protein [Streptantibioticus silvisoli]
MSIWWSLHLRCEAASVPLARRMLLGTMETAGIDPDISYDLSVALSEACANAVEHAATTGTGPDEYRVTASIDDDRCHIEVTDSGPGFPVVRGPRPVRTLHGHASYAESGRGLFLIEALMDHVQISNTPGNGAVVTFDKSLKPPTGTFAQAS